MTDRYAGFLVTLDHDVRDDDAEAVVNALRMVKHVISVEPVISDVELHIAESRADHRWRNAIYKLAAEGPEG